MKPQRTDLKRWIEIDTDHGIQWIMYDTVFPSQNAKTMSPTYSDINNFIDCKADDIISIDIVDGYGIRMSMDGYLDCTEWEVYYSETIAKSYFNKMEVDIKKSQDYSGKNIELQDGSGEYHYWTIDVKQDRVNFGSVCNVGLLSEGYILRDTSETLDETLQELIADLQVSITDGKKFISRIKFNEEGN